MQNEVQFPHPYTHLARKDFSDPGLCDSSLLSDFRDLAMVLKDKSLHGAGSQDQGVEVRFRDCGVPEIFPLEPPGGSQVRCLPLQRARKYGHTLKGSLNAPQVPGNNFMPLILIGWETTSSMPRHHKWQTLVSHYPNHSLGHHFIFFLWNNKHDIMAQNIALEPNKSKYNSEIYHLQIL